MISGSDLMLIRLWELAFSVYLFFHQIPNWFHFNCFWRRARVKDLADIHGVSGLRWEDQQKIKDKLTGSGM